MMCFLLHLSPGGDGLWLMLGNCAGDLILALLFWFLTFGLLERDHAT